MEAYKREIRSKTYIYLRYKISGTVHLEMRMNDAGKYEYRYLFVQLDYYPNQTIILVDDRIHDPLPQNNNLTLATIN